MKNLFTRKELIILFIAVIVLVIIPVSANILLVQQMKTMDELIKNEQDNHNALVRQFYIKEFKK